MKAFCETIAIAFYWMLLFDESVLFKN